jgi:serine phosphatase RsbU (regulator of sigma subunit)
MTLTGTNTHTRSLSTPILVVDDDQATLLLLRRTLEGAGYTNVEIAAHPREVPRMFAETRPRLVLLDLHLPEIDGLELMEQLGHMTEEQRSVPFLVVTADATDQTKRRALSLGARDFLTKPLDHVELLLRVRNLLAVQHLQDRLLEQNAHLEHQRLGLLSDLGAMQAALVPEVSARVGGLEVSVAYRPAEGPAAGGDFYDLFVPQPGKVAIVLGDASGHGREALTHAALTRYTLRAYLQAGLEPRTALALAGRVLADPTGERYATVAVGVYSAQTSTLTYALAGHPPPLLTRQGRQTHEPVTVCSSPPIGWGMPTGRRQTTVSLAAGTEACFFSDGLIEARHDGHVLGRECLHEILASLGPHARAEKLLEAVRATARVPDDMVACMLSPESAAADERVHIEELEVDTPTLSRNGVGRFLRTCVVAPAQVRRTLRHARRVAAVSGTALLRVQREPPGACVTVTPPASDKTEA